MGVKGLLKFLSINSDIIGDGSIRRIGFHELRNKTIVVDASIYMYRFKQEGDLAEMMYHFLSLMRYYNVKLIFVFDGKPPDNKLDTIQSRRDARSAAKSDHSVQTKQLVDLMEQYHHEQNSPDPDSLRIKEYKKRIDRLEFKIESSRRNAVTIRYTDFELVKSMLDMMGVYHTTPEQEADSLCARFVTSGIAYACLTEDTDLFVYGCDRIIRGLDIFSKSVMLYPTKQIYKSIGLSMQEFQMICFLSGTDYFDATIDGGITSAYKLYRQSKSCLFPKIVDDILRETGTNTQTLLDNYSCTHCASDIASYNRNCHSVRYDDRLTRVTMRQHGFIYV